MDDEHSTHDARDQDVASGGYPETNPDGADAEGTARTRKDGAAEDRAPSTSTDKEADRTASTGNPGAAG
jgi:hypothetical protein